MSTPAAPPPPPLDHAHHAPPPHIRAVHKKLQKATADRPPEDVPILDLSSVELPEYHRKRIKLSGAISRAVVDDVFAQFEAAAGCPEAYAPCSDADIPIYTHSSVPGMSPSSPWPWQKLTAPGLLIVPSLLPPSTQSTLLTTLLTRSLPLTETHQTNLHLHYRLPAPPFDFFIPSPSTLLHPQTDLHKPLTLAQALTKKLRWMTLGGQYDWTAKKYPTSTAPAFPPDVAGLVEGLFAFEHVRAQAAIVNLYSPGDTLSPHRDISEGSGRGLVSISVGCAGWFVIGCDGGEEEREVLAVRLNSGDAVVMAGESRWAWHSVPKILAGTGPRELEGWDGGSDGQWEGWMKGKRVNLNVRQMWDPEK